MVKLRRSFYYKLHHTTNK